MTVPASHASGIPSDIRNWGVGAHLSGYVGFVAAFAFLGPLVVWLIKRDAHPFIDHHGKEALNFQLSVLLYLVVGAIAAIPIAIFTVGLGLLVLIPVGLALAVAWLVLPIVAAVRASNGEGYRYPVTIRFIS